MSWNDFLNFLDMGGYAFYVWSSWGLTLLIVVYLLLEAKLNNTKIKRSLKRQLIREQSFTNSV